MRKWFLLANQSFLLLGLTGLFAPCTWAQESKLENPTQAAEPDPKAAQASASVAAALDIVGRKIKAAKVSRATVELTSRARIGDQEISNEKAVYQIASASPNRYTVYYKTEPQSFRVFCDGEKSSVLVSPQAYFKTPVPDSLQSVVTNLPVPMGPYPEPVMALTLCGVDPKESLMVDMESVEIVDRESLNQTPAVHLRGTQLDGVSWDLWLATSKEQAQPLKMVIDLTKVVQSDQGPELPEGFAYEIELLFTLWRVNVEIDPKLFILNPPADAVEYKSLDDYYRSEIATAGQQKGIGKPAPDFEAVLFNHGAAQQDAAQTADGEVTKVKLSGLKGKIVVLDFWATWCGPCIEAMPVLTAVTGTFADRDVVFYAVNVGEPADDVARFFADKEFKPNVLLDASATMADSFQADAIPQTVIVGKDGRIESVHVGYATLEAFEKELKEQLEVLASGGTLIPETE